MENIRNTQTEQTPEPIVLPGTLSDEQLDTMQFDPTDTNVEQLIKQRDVLIAVGGQALKNINLGEESYSSPLKAVYTVGVLNSSSDTAREPMYGLHVKTDENGHTQPAWYVMNGDNHGDHVVRPEEHGLPDPVKVFEKRQAVESKATSTDTTPSYDSPNPDILTPSTIEDETDIKSTFEKLVAEAKEAAAAISEQINKATEDNNRLNYALETVVDNIQTAILRIRNNVITENDPMFQGLIGSFNGLMAGNGLLKQSTDSLEQVRKETNKLEEIKDKASQTDTDDEKSNELKIIEDPITELRAQSLSGEENNKDIRTKLDLIARALNEYATDYHRYTAQGRPMDAQHTVLNLSNMLNEITYANDSRNASLGSSHGLQHQLAELKKSLDRLV